MPQPALAPDSASPIGLPGLVAFECVARHMNFSRAAAEMGVTPTAISRTVKQLEARLGARLFNRTTRSVALTEAGSGLLETLAPALEQIKRSVQSVSDASGAPRGLLRLNVSYVAYAVLIEPNLPRFLDAYPQVTLEATIDNGLSNIVAGGFDAGIRLGHALQKDMIAVPLGPPQRPVVVGAPAYFERRRRPSKPEDLLQHDCIRQRIGHRGQFLAWRFGAKGKAIDVDVRGRLVFSEMQCALEAACRGHGLAYVFEPFAAPALQAGRVITVLDKFSRAGERFHLYYPNRSQMPGKLRVLIDVIRSTSLQGEPAPA